MRTRTLVYRYTYTRFNCSCHDVNTHNLEGMPTFNVQAMVRGYRVYQHVWAASIPEVHPCAREADNLRDPFAVAVLFQPSFQNSFSGTVRSSHAHLRFTSLLK